MLMQKKQGEIRKDGVDKIVAVAIDTNKGSQNAMKWAIDHLLTKDSVIVLIYVKVKTPPVSSLPYLSAPRAKAMSNGECTAICKDPDEQTRELFCPYRVFCARKDIQCKDVVLEDVDVAKALIEYISYSAIGTLVLGSSNKAGFLRRFKASDIPATVSKGVPDFCTVYVISKGKIQSMRTACRPAPAFSPLLNEISQSMRSNQSESISSRISGSVRGRERRSIEIPRRSNDGTDSFRQSFDGPRRSYDPTDLSFRSPLTGKAQSESSFGEYSLSDIDISFVSSGRPSTERFNPYSYNSSDAGMYKNRLSYSSDTDGNYSFESMSHARISLDISSTEFSYISNHSESSASQATDDVEAELRRLKLELKQTMEMYSTACKEALTAQQKAGELQRWKLEEERRLEEARLAEEAALAIVETEKAKSKAAVEAAEAQKKIAELEAQKRLKAEIKAFKEAEEKKKAIYALSKKDIRYRRYSIEEIEAATDSFAESRKIGEGGYGPVFKCHLDHTPVAVKVLRPDAAQGRSQFQREVEVLSCIRHPNMVLLLGACPEYGCLVYEYMANGSLDDCLFCRGNSPPLPWQLRFKIAAEIGTGLLFLQQTKPEALVHRDLKPGNILLDKNYVAKISDVGLARLVPPSVADTVTQYHLTSAAGTFCYIDPEYQQTGMLGVKSDIYSFGIILLQILTARPPMGLTHHVERSIEKGTFADDMLDPKVVDWPVEEALCLAKLALKCSELRKKDRPDLGKEVQPELNRLRKLSESADQYYMFNGFMSPSNRSQVSVQLEPYSGESLRNSSSTV